MKARKKLIKQYRGYRYGKKVLFWFSILELSILSVLIIGGSAAAYYRYESTHKLPVKEVTTAAVKNSGSGALCVSGSTSCPSTQPLATSQPSSATPSTTTPKLSTTQSSTDSSQALEYENEAIAAEKQAEQEKFCLNIDSLAYGTFKNTQSSALSEVESQIASIDATNTSLGQPVQDTYTPITQVYETYNSTVNTAYSTYTSSDTSQGCQSTDTTPPSNYTIPFNG